MRERSAGHRRSLTRLAACVGLLAVLMIPMITDPSAAWAHAQLATTVPVDGATVPDPPHELVLTFNEAVSPPPNAIRLFDAKGDRLQTGGATTSDGGTTLHARIAEDLARGSYVVAWRATSADGHPVRGAFTFAVGAATSGTDRAGLLAAIVPEENEAGWQIAAAISRWLLYVSALIAAGGVAFMLRVHDRRENERATLARIVTVAAAVAAVASVAGSAWQAILEAGTGVGALADTRALTGVLTSGFGSSTVVRLVGLTGIGLAAPRLWSRPAAWISSAGALLVVGSFLLTGHAAASSPQALVTIADLAHTAAGAVWFGGLVLLLVALRRRRTEGDALGAAALVARFSELATIAVIAVVAAGTALAWAEVRAVRALTSTAYGWTLLVKLVLVGLIVAGGAYNHRRLVPAIKARTADAWGTLRRVVRLEAVGIVAVLAVTAVLTNLVPARTAAGIGGFFNESRPMGDYSLDVTVDPNRAGRNELHIYLLGANGQPTDAGAPQDMRVQFSLPAKDIGPIERTASVSGPGHWTLAGDEMAFPGQWQVTFTLPTSKFEQLQTEVTVPVN